MGLVRRLVGRGVALAAAFAAGLVAGACRDAAHDCEPGIEGCACADGECLLGSECQAGICVASDGGTTSTNGGTSTSTSSGTSPESTSDEADTGDPSAPVLGELVADKAAFAPGLTVLFTTTLSHPNGLAAIASGLLVDTDTGTPYGEFAAGNAGTYTVSLSWDELNAAVPIDAERGHMFGFDAVFTDTDGDEARATVALGMDCFGVDACAGVCVDWSSDLANCGGCGTVCEGEEICLSGCRLPAWSPCFYPEDMSCDQACTKLGQLCIANGCESATYAVFDEPNSCLDRQYEQFAPGECDTNYVPTDPGGFIQPPEYMPTVRCCCA